MSTCPEHRRSRDPEPVAEPATAAGPGTGVHHAPDYAQIRDHAEVVAQLAMSTDGFIAARSGDAQFVSADADRTHLHRLRAAVTTVLVGARTVITDDPQLTVRAVDGQNPVRAILDPHARIGPDSRVLVDDTAPTLWLVAHHASVPRDVAEHVTVARLPEHSGARVEPAQVLELIRSHYPGAVLVEGGGRTVSDVLSAALLDRLFLTTCPVLIGDGVPGVRFTGSPVMAEALRAPFRRHELGPDMCTEFVLSPGAVERTPGLQRS